MSNRNFKLTISLLLILTCALGAGFFVPYGYADDFEDNFCEEKLHGTFGKETCYATCKKPELSCRVAQTHKAKYNEGLDRDLDCYGCAYYESCYDIGYIPFWPDCPTICEANPKKKCSRSIPVAGPLGIGPGAIPVPNTMNGQACYACIDKKDECSLVWPNTSWLAQCQNDCAGKPNSRCVQKGVHPVEGYACFECKNFGPAVEKCSDRGAISRAQCAATCKVDEICWPTGPVVNIAAGNPELCFGCIPKLQQPPWPPWPPPQPLTCEDYGWSTPPAQCDPKTEVVQTQSFPSAPGIDIDCYQCVPGQCIPHPPQYTYQQCQDECVSVGGQCRGRTHQRGEPDCYACVMPDDDEPPKTCTEAGLADGCDPFPCDAGETCKVEAVKLASGKTQKCGICYLDDTIPSDQCEQYEMYPNCAPCYQASHSCRMNKVTDDPALWCAECYIQCADDNAIPGDCSLAGSCPSDKPVCMVTEDQCHTCHPQPQCEDPLASGACPQECSDGYFCRNMGEYCYMCVEGEPECRDDADCDDGLFCNGVETCANGFCRSGENPCPANETCDEDSQQCLPEQTICYNSQQQDGPCYQGACDGGSFCKEFDYDGTKCHWCQMRPVTGVCTDLGIPGACPAECSDGQLCIGRPGPCHLCMTVERIEITYIIIIIETPRGRVVLKDLGFDPGELTGFSPQSIMALAKVDNAQLAQFQKLAALANSGFSMGSIKDIAGMLKDKLGAKKARYNDGCFSGLGTEGAKGAKKKKEKKRKNDAAGVSFEKDKGRQYATDVERNLSVDGPVLACGQTNGEDTLAVFDAKGALMKNISKNELLENPMAIYDALKKAETAYQKFEYVKNLRPEGWLKKAVSTLVQKLASPRPSENDFKSVQKAKAKKEKKRKKRGEAEVVINPNDPLYLQLDEKKTKLFGVLGGSSRGPVVMGGKAGSILEREPKKGLELKDQWGIKAIGFTPLSDPDSAWNMVDSRQENVVVAVIDSGLDMTHPDSPQYIWTNSDEIPDNKIDDDANGFIDDVHGWNFIDNTNDLRDFKGHGTFVTGIIAAKTNNGMGIAGINPGAIIMPLKVANKEGEALNLNIYRAIHYAVDQGARVINISLGGRSVSTLEQAAINYAHQEGVFVTIASGNTGEYMGNIGPASADHGFAVGAIDYDMVRSTISSVGPNNALMAPGEEIISLRSIDSFNKRAFSEENPERLYFRQSGTSFSAPMVAATASLLLVKNAQLTNVEIEDILTGTATDIDDKGWDDMTGAGILNPLRALQSADQEFLSIKITHVRKNMDKNKKVVSVDLFGTVRGDFKEFSVEVGKGKRAKRFKRVAGPFTAVADHSWIARIDKDFIRGSKDWVVRLNVIDAGGNARTAKMLLLVE
ncbi:S8 family serine peptidase [Candidatus Omnitrophota bacterium]